MPYSAVFPAALTFAHLALAIAASYAFTAGLTFLFFFAPCGLPAALFTLAHLAFAAALMAALPAALNRRLPFLGNFEARAAVPLTVAFAIALICPSSVSICSLMETMRFSWAVVSSIKFNMDNWLCYCG